MESLDRFKIAQAGSYERVLKEVKAGNKSNHWIWYIFPQIQGLGISENSILYSIKNLEEAKSYLLDEILSARYIQLTEILANEVNGKTAEEIFSYCSAILATPRYAELFNEELITPGPRIPISKRYEIFHKASTLGTKFIWLQTFGERWVSPNPCPNLRINGSAKIDNPICGEAEDYPDSYSYNPVDHTLKIGNGTIFNVRPEVYNYSQSGFKPVESWLRYRMKKRAGRAGKDTTRSSLDTVRPQKWTFTNELLELLWVIEGCVDLWPELEAVLNEVTQGPLISLDKLTKPTDSERNEPEIGDQIQLRLI